MGARRAGEGDSGFTGSIAKVNASIRRSVIVILVVVVQGIGARGADVDYLRDIKPILKNRCWTCHGSVKQKSDLRLDAGKLIHAGGKEGKVIIAHQPDESRLIARLAATDKDERMPPDGTPLSKKQIELLKAWIANGAGYPADEEIPAKPSEHWAFQPVQKPDIPLVKDGRWPRNGIDHFVLARLEKKGWKPNPDAEPGRLLRRVHLDLIGLPPSIAEQKQYAAAYSTADYAALIDELLGRKGYGERYARHWLDVVRYADSNAYERDGAKPEVWRYRDYVIGSLNTDKPFDRFLIEQLAGDELPDATTETVIATGFNRLGPWDDEPADFAMDRFDQLDDIVNTTSQAFLGLTMGCARCHDHKFDPLLQKDYYSMVAVFNPLKRPQRGRSELTRYAAHPELVARLEDRDKRIGAENSVIKKLREDFAGRLLRDGRSEVPADVQAAFLVAPAKRNGNQKKLVSANQSKLDEEVELMMLDVTRNEIAGHQESIAKLKRETPDSVQGYFMFEAAPVPPETRLLKRGNPKAPGEIVEPAVPVVLAKKQPDFLPSSKHTSRRRLSLAQWMTRPDNPLTARVIVNRVWQWHFGEGLVRTPNDFGLIGEKPTHPELLDWLAHWFIHDAKWSLKKLHRLIMTSRTYQMSRDVNPVCMPQDPETRLLWRHPPRRLEVEAIRDSILFVSGQLSREMYGPPMHPFVPREALLNHADKTSIWPAFDETKASRRTVYAFIKRSLLVPLLEVFDLCDTTQTSPKRQVTTVPTQALTLFNGDFAMRQSRHFAERLIREAGDNPDGQIDLAWRLAFARQPTPDERRAMRQFVDVQLAELRSGMPSSAPMDRKKMALTQMCRVVFNLNEFVYPD